jgi:hypothetical protein
VAIGIDNSCVELGGGARQGKRIEREAEEGDKRGIAIDLLTILLLKALWCLWGGICSFVFLSLFLVQPRRGEGNRRRSQVLGCGSVLTD